MTDTITTIAGPRRPEVIEFREKWLAAIERANLEGLPEDTYIIPLLDDVLSRETGSENV